MRILKAFLTLGLLIVFLAGCISIPIGDGKLKVGKDGFTVTDEEGEEHSVAFDEDNDQLTISGSDGEMSFGGEVAIPDSFPKDIPIADDAVVFAATEMQMTFSVSYATEKDASEIDEMYNNFVNSSAFKDSSKSSFAAEGITVIEYTGEMQDGNFNVNIHDSLEDGVVVIVFVDQNNYE